MLSETMQLVNIIYSWARCVISLVRILIVSDMTVYVLLLGGIESQHRGWAIQPTLCCDVRKSSCCQFSSSFPPHPPHFDYRNHYFKYSFY